MINGVLGFFCGGGHNFSIFIALGATSKKFLGVYFFKSDFKVYFCKNPIGSYFYIGIFGWSRCSDRRHGENLKILCSYRGTLLSPPPS